MKFSEITGNGQLKQTLVSMVDNGRVPHAILLYENDGGGAVPIALTFIQYLNCRHRHDGEPCGECPSCKQASKLIYPDTHYVFPVNKSTKVKDDKPTSESFVGLWRELVLDNPWFREEDLQETLGIEGKKGEIALQEAKNILNTMSLTPVADGYKAIICYLPEKMNATAANKLLKMVEEPPEKSVFVFITHSPEKMMQTIFSRCQSMRVLPLTRQEQALVSGSEKGDAELSAIAADMLNACVERNLLEALNVSETAAALPSREKQKDFLLCLSEVVRGIFLVQNSMEELLDLSEADARLCRKLAGVLRKAFCPKVSAAIDGTVRLLDRNVNSKMLFCDLVDRIFASI